MATVKGVWVLNDTLSFPAATIKQDVYFTTDPNSGAAYSDWTRIRVYTTSLDYERYLGGGGTAQTIYRKGTWQYAAQTVDFGETDQTVSDTFYEWLNANATQQASGVPFDLSTLNLPAGTHRITVKARADGYADSAESEAVEYVVESEWSTESNETGTTVILDEYSTEPNASGTTVIVS